MWVASKEEKKRALREATLAKLHSLSQVQCRLWSDAIQARALDLTPYLACRSVVLYSPIGSEVRTEKILERSLSAGRKVFYPKLRSDAAVELARVDSADELKAGRWGILEPVGAKPLGEIDRQGLVVFVPGMAFDKSGNRVGRGIGWYDRLLADLGDKAASVALAYELQLVESVPTEAWDRKVDYIVTEERLMDCTEASQPLSRMCQ